MKTYSKSLYGLAIAHIALLTVGCCAASAWACQSDHPAVTVESGTRIVPVERRDDGPHIPGYRLRAYDHGVVLQHGDGPDRCDYLGARDVWVWKYKDTYYMHYDGAGPNGWLVCLAVTKDLLNWDKKGAILDLGKPGEDDSASASYGTIFYDGKKWRMFYLGTPRASPRPDFVPVGPYYTMMAEADSPAGPWRKRPDFVALRPTPETGANASPGQVIKHKGEYLMFFSGLGIARAKIPDGPWTVDTSVRFPAYPCENASLYYEKTNDTWFLFTNHIGEGYTDAIWVYWTKDLNKWDSRRVAVAFDGRSCKWSKTIIGLPSVLRVGSRLALFYDGNRDPKDRWHMHRDIGLAWIDLPLIPPDG